MMLAVRALPPPLLLLLLLLSAGLSALLPDVPPPALLHNLQLTSTNLWFSSSCSRSSLHYDPYQNLLCVVTGRGECFCHLSKVYPVFARG
jgi:hypothetical protein